MNKQKYSQIIHVLELLIIILNLLNLIERLSQLKTGLWSVHNLRFNRSSLQNSWRSYTYLLSNKRKLATYVVPANFIALSVFRSYMELTLNQWVALNVSTKALSSVNFFKPICLYLCDSQCACCITLCNKVMLYSMVLSTPVFRSLHLYTNFYLFLQRMQGLDLKWV